MKRERSSTRPWAALVAVGAMEVLAAGCLDLIGYRDHDVRDSFTTGPTGTGGAEGGTGGTGGAALGGGTDGACEPGSMKACYSGPSGTQDIGACKGGTQACGLDGIWGACVGEVLPDTEDCSKAGDEDCNFAGVGCSEAVWSKIFGDVSKQWATDIAADDQGNVYLLGTFGGSVSFGGETFISQGREVFLAKFDKEGQHLWSKHFGDGNLKTYSADLVVDALGSVTISGGFQGTLDFGTGPMTFSGASLDRFVVKLDSSGGVIWARHFVDGFVGDMAVDSNGDIVIAGPFNGMVDFGGGTILDAQTGNMYLAKLASATGLPLWAKNFANVDNTVFALAVDPSDNILLAGTFSESLALTTGDLIASGVEMFLVRFNAEGQTAWGRHFLSGAVSRADLAVDSTGAILLVFSTDAPVDMGKGLLEPLGLQDIIAARYNSGGVLEWSRRWGGSGSDIDPRVTFDSHDRAVIAMSSEGPFDYGEGVLPAGTSFDVAVVQLDTAGAPRWARRLGDASTQWLSSVATGPDAEVLLGCSVMGTIDFGNGPLVAKDDVGEDVAIAKIAP